MNETVFSQIMDIRDSGRVNMFDIPAVQRMAFKMEFYELICFIERDRAARSEPHLIEVLHRGGLRPSCFCVSHFVFLAFCV